jgi:hypothetical protein
MFRRKKWEDERFSVLCFTAWDGGFAMGWSNVKIEETRRIQEIGTEGQMSKMRTFF